MRSRRRRRCITVTPHLVLLLRWLLVAAASLSTPSSSSLYLRQPPPPPPPTGGCAPPPRTAAAIAWNHQSGFVADGPDRRRRRRSEGDDDDGRAGRGASATFMAASSSSSEERTPRGGGGGKGGNMSMEKIRAFADKNFFLLGMFVSVSAARILPSLGKNGGILQPELFIGQYGVTAIFLLSGLSLQLTELTDAVTRYRLNSLVQFLIFAAWPALIGLPLTRVLLPNFAPNLLPKSILDGLLICTCLPTTVNMCVLLTSASGGNVASALSNAVISNVGGIFATPALLFRFFGESIALPFGDMVVKLCNKVLLPVAVGQALRATPAKDFYTKNSKIFKRLQELILLGIAWNAFCNAFARGLGLELHHSAALLTLLPLMHLSALASTFALFRWKPWGFTRGEAVAGAFCSSQKTLAFGLPLVNTIFEGSPNLAAYCAPIMFIHPLQLVLGSLCVPTFSRFTDGGERRDEK